MDLALATASSFMLVYLMDRTVPVPAWARPAVFGAGAAAALGLLGVDGVYGFLLAVLASTLAVVLSEVVSMLQAATDALRVRVISAATTRRGGRIPPL